MWLNHKKHTTKAVRFFIWFDKNGIIKISIINNKFVRGEIYELYKHERRYTYIY